MGGLPFGSGWASLDSGAFVFRKWRLLLCALFFAVLFYELLALKWEYNSPDAVIPIGMQPPGDASSLIEGSAGATFGLAVPVA